MTGDITAEKGRQGPVLYNLYHSWHPAEARRARSLKQEFSEGYKICDTGMQQHRQIMKKQEQRKMDSPRWKGNLIGTVRGRHEKAVQRTM